MLIRVLVNVTKGRPCTQRTLVLDFLRCRVDRVEIVRTDAQSTLFVIVKDIMWAMIPLAV